MPLLKNVKLLDSSFVNSPKVGTYGENHPDTASSYNNLAVLYYSQREYKITLDYLLKAYKVFTFKLGLQHPNTQIVYENMEMIYSEWKPEGNFKQWLEEKIKETKQEYKDNL